jgi:hypothetical protein
MKILLLLAASASALAASPRQASSPDPKEYAAFKIIADRNIFDPNRSSRASRANRETRRPSRVDTITLVGTMSYEKGPFAFFRGSSSQYQQVLRIGESIAGFTVADITDNSVRLESGAKKVELTVGRQMRREEEGEWEMSGGERVTTAGSAEPSSASATADEPANATSDGENDTLKRLMQQREQELK